MTQGATAMHYPTLSILAATIITPYFSGSNAAGARDISTLNILRVAERGTS